NKLIAFLKAGLQYVTFFLLLILSLGISTYSIFAGLILALSASLVLPIIRERFILQNLRHPFLTFIVIAVALVTALDMSNQTAKIAKEKKQHEMALISQAEKQKSLALFSANPQPKIDEIKSLIEKEDFRTARNQINSYKEANN